MFESIIAFFKNTKKSEKNTNSPKDAAKERLHLVLMQDRANVSADFLELMKQEIIEVIKKYIDVDEESIDVKLTNQENEDGTNGAPALYANIPILHIKNEVRKIEGKETVEKGEKKTKKGTKKSEKKEGKSGTKAKEEKVIEKEEKPEKKEKDKIEVIEEVEDKEKKLNEKEEAEKDTKKQSEQEKKEEFKSED